jgi:Rrf2 family protein
MALAEMARREAGQTHPLEARPASIADIAAAQHLSPAYLEQLFARLRRYGMVEGVRGPGGGYQLSRKADRISIAQIIADLPEGDPVRVEGEKQIERLTQLAEFTGDPRSGTGAGH